jgi:hypothetical protein
MFAKKYPRLIFAKEVANERQKFFVVRWRVDDKRTEQRTSGSRQSEPFLLKSQIQNKRA